MMPLAGLVVLDFSRVLAAPHGNANPGGVGCRGHQGRTAADRRREPAVGADAAGRGKRLFLRVQPRKAVDHAQPQIAARPTDRPRPGPAGPTCCVENFLPGDMDRMGLGYEALSADNKRLVYVSNTGFGQDGPYRDRKGYDTIFQALSGVMALTGHPDGPPAKVGVPFAGPEFRPMDRDRHTCRVGRPRCQRAGQPYRRGDARCASESAHHRRRPVVRAE